MKTVTASTRAPRTGKIIYCPKCGSVHRVFHFSWSATFCHDCDNMINKYEYLLEKPTHIEKPDRPVYSLVFDRNFCQYVLEFSEVVLEPKGYYFDEVDASGSRQVWHYKPVDKQNYDDAEDLPFHVWDDFKLWVWDQFKKQPDDFSVCRRMIDPGLGIMLPEDFELIKQGGLPDGCIRVADKSQTNNKQP